LASVSASFASLPSASCRSRSASSHSPIFMWHTASPLCSSGCVSQRKRQGQDIRGSHVSTTPKACGRLQARCAAAAALTAEEGHSSGNQACQHMSVQIDSMCKGGGQSVRPQHHPMLWPGDFRICYIHQQL
jgi:hypothetical protein